MIGSFLGYQLSCNFGGLDYRSDCNALVLEWRKRRVEIRRHRHDGTSGLFTFLPQEDRVVLPVTNKESGKKRKKRAAVWLKHWII